MIKQNQNFKYQQNEYYISLCDNGGSSLYRKVEIGNKIFILKTFTLDRNVIGVRSTTKDNKHVLFLDCDKVDIDWLIERARRMIEKFRLSSIYILKTNVRSYHLVCLDKFEFEEILYMQAWFDKEMLKHYMIFGIRRGYWVLRTSHKFARDKPSYHMTLNSMFYAREQSTAHADVLMKHFDIDVKLRAPDNYDVVVKDVYNTVR